MPMTLFFWSFKILLFPWKKNLHILVIDWSFNNKLTVNTSKTKEIVFRRSRFPNKLLPLLLPDIQRVDSIKLLGVYLSHTLSPDQHINHLLSQCKQSSLLAQISESFSSVLRHHFPGSYTL